MSATELRTLVTATVFIATLLSVSAFSIGSQDRASTEIKCWRLGESTLDICYLNGWFKLMKDGRELASEDLTSSGLPTQLLLHLLVGRHNPEATNLFGQKKEEKEKRKFDSISYNNGMGGF